jgi:membrane protein implicated in regulation of membrane protease activity
MAILLAVLLAVFLLPSPWNVVVVVVAAVWELGTAGFGFWYSKRGAAHVGVETLVGRTATVILRCDPLGQVKLDGEIWAACCAETAEVGETVRVRSIDRLTLNVNRALPSA